MSENTIVLMVEDDVNLLTLNANMLKRKGYSVHTAQTLKEARALQSELEKIDIAVLDIMLPDGNGLAFASEIKGKNDCPVLMLTSKNKHEDIVEGMSSDADMYMVKPYFIDEFIARVEGLLKKQQKDNHTSVIRGNLRLDLSLRQAKLNDVDLALTSREFSLLLYLARREDEVVPAETVYKEVWGQLPGGEKAAIQNAVSRLRKKLQNSGYNIVASRNEGYVFERS